MGCVDQGLKYYADPQTLSPVSFEQSESYEVVIEAGLDTL